MSKKVELSTGEIAVEWLSEDVGYWFREQGKKLIQLKLVWKGAGWLAIIIMKHEGERYVGFVGADSLVGVARKMLRQLKADEVNWKVDEYEDGA